MCGGILGEQVFFVLKSDPLYIYIILYFNQIMIEFINSRNVPNLFKDYFVKFTLFSFFFALVCIVLYVYKP